MFEVLFTPDFLNRSVFRKSYIQLGLWFLLAEKKLAKIVRYLLGLALLFFGLNGFFLFVTPSALASAAMEFFGAMIATGYLLPLTNIVFLLVVMLLTNKYVPFSLVLLAPIMLNVVFFHIFLDPASGIGGYVVGLFNLYLMIVHVDAYRPMLRK